MTETDTDSLVSNELMHQKDLLLSQMNRLIDVADVDFVVDELSEVYGKLKFVFRFWHAFTYTYKTAEICDRAVKQLDALNETLTFRHTSAKARVKNLRQKFDDLRTLS